MAASDDNHKSPHGDSLQRSPTREHGLCLDNGERSPEDRLIPDKSLSIRNAMASHHPRHLAQ